MKIRTEVVSGYEEIAALSNRLEQEDHWQLTLITVVEYQKRSGLGTDEKLMATSFLLTFRKYD